MPHWISILVQAVSGYFSATILRARFIGNQLLVVGRKQIAYNWFAGVAQGAMLLLAMRFWFRPSQGIAIVLLALAAVFMAVREPLSKGEKIGWIIVALSLCTVEIIGITKAQDRARPRAVRD